MFRHKTKRIMFLIILLVIIPPFLCLFIGITIEHLYLFFSDRAEKREIEREFEKKALIRQLTEIQNEATTPRSSLNKIAEDVEFSEEINITIKN